MICRVCKSTCLKLHGTDEDGFQWFACPDCGSHSSTAPYTPERYGRDYIDRLFVEEGPNALVNHDPNVQVFERHAGKKRGLFLDVGCGFGASMAVMWSAGWDVMGWDVAFAGRPKRIVMSPRFASNLFWQRFDAVLCREVLEHVLDGQELLEQLYDVAKPGGLVQVTTPKPLYSCKEHFCYQWPHLVLWSPDALVRTLQRIGFVVLESIIWKKGQIHLCQRPIEEGKK